MSATKSAPKSAKLRRRRRVAPLPRQKPKLELLTVNALTDPQGTVIVGTPATPAGDVACYLAPLDSISNGPNIPVLRYLATLAQGAQDRVVIADRENIAKAVRVSERHVSRALATLLQHGFITRVEPALRHHTYKVNLVPVYPLAATA